MHMFHELLSRSKNTVVNLYIFPHAGGDVHSYNKFSDNLHPSIRPRILQLPGRGRQMSKDFVIDMDTLVTQIIDNIKDDLATPYMFYGHSLGGIVLFSLFNKIQEYGLNRPEVLFISGVDDPKTFSDNHPKTAEMTDEELVSYLIELSSSNKEIYEDKQICELFLPIIRADFQLAQSYKYVADIKQLVYGNTQLVYFHSSDDEKTSEYSIKGWEGQCVDRNNFYAIETIGDHMHIPNNPEVITPHINEIILSQSNL